MEVVPPTGERNVSIPCAILPRGEVLSGKMRPFYALTWIVTRRILEVFFDFSSPGMEKVPLEGGLLVVANHASYLDPPIVGAALPRELYYLARRTLFRHPLFARLIRAYHAIPVELERPDPVGLRAVLRALRKGRAVLLFPEGTRTPDGRMGEARMGAGFVACHAGVPILPVRIFGTYEVLPRHRKWPRFFPIRVVIGSPFHIPQVEEEPRSRKRKEVYQEAAWEMKRRILELA